MQQRQQLVHGIPRRSPQRHQSGSLQLQVPARRAFKKRQARGLGPSGPTDGISCPHGSLAPEKCSLKARRAAVPPGVWQYISRQMAASSPLSADRPGPGYQECAEQRSSEPMAVEQSRDRSPGGATGNGHSQGGLQPVTPAAVDLTSMSGASLGECAGEAGVDVCVDKPL